MSVHVHTATTVLGAGLIQTGMNLTSQMETLIKAVFIVAILAAILVIGVKSKFAAGAMVAAILVGGAVIWGITNINIIKDKVGQDLNAAPAVQVDVVAPPAVL